MGIFGNHNNQAAPVFDDPATNAAQTDEPHAVTDDIASPAATIVPVQDAGSSAPLVQDAGTDVPAEDYIMTGTTLPAPAVDEHEHDDVHSPAYNDYTGAPKEEPAEPGAAEAGVIAQDEEPQSDPEAAAKTESAGTAKDESTADEEPGTIEEPEAAEESTADAAGARPSSDSPDDLSAIKQQALQQLSPLIGHLNQSPEERFNTTMMMLQATDDQTLVKAAYEAARAITGEKAKAQALLDIVNEIDYLTKDN
ncbi:MAG: hypothetical protein WAQ57_00610 [Candidatus Saccharimonadales bacterium]